MDQVEQELANISNKKSDKDAWAEAGFGNGFSSPSKPKSLDMASKVLAMVFSQVSYWRWACHLVVAASTSLWCLLQQHLSLVLIPQACSSQFKDTHLPSVLLMLMIMPHSGIPQIILTHISGRVGGSEPDRHHWVSSHYIKGM